MKPTHKQLLAEVTLTSADTAPLEAVLGLALDFIRRETQLVDLGRALGRAYPGTTPLPVALSRVTFPSTVPDHAPRHWRGGAIRDLVTTLHTYELSALAEVLLLDAQQRAFASATRPPRGRGDPPKCSSPTPRDIARLRILIDIHNPRVTHDPALCNQFAPIRSASNAGPEWSEAP